MTTLQLLPVVAYAIVVMALVIVALRGGTMRPMDWVVPLVATLLFVPFSAYTVGVEGLSLFWSNHTTNLSGNQVWFDLLLATAIGFYLLAPRAKAVGMPLLPWAVATFSLACIALLPMLARVLWLERSRPVCPADDPNQHSGDSGTEYRTT